MNAIITNADAREAIRAEFDKRVKAYGSDQGKGDLSLVALANDSIRMAADDIIGADDAKEVFENFQKARIAAADKAAGKLAGTTVYEPMKSLPVQVSKFRQIILMGSLLNDQDGVKVMDRALDIRAKASEDDAKRKAIKGKTYDFMLDIARNQLSDDAQKIPLSDEQIEDVLFPTKKEKGEADALKAILKSMERLRDGRKDEPGTGCPSAELDSAIDAIEARLSDLGASEKDEEAELKALLIANPAMLKAMSKSKLKSLGL
jgi:hypothetical protein